MPRITKKCLRDNNTAASNIGIMDPNLYCDKRFAEPPAQMSRCSLRISTPQHESLYKKRNISPVVPNCLYNEIRSSKLRPKRHTLKQSAISSSILCNSDKGSSKNVLTKKTSTFFSGSDLRCDRYERPSSNHVSVNTYAPKCSNSASDYHDRENKLPEEMTRSAAYTQSTSNYSISDDRRNCGSAGNGIANSSYVDCDDKRYNQRVRRKSSNYTNSTLSGFNCEDKRNYVPSDNCLTKYISDNYLEEDGGKYYKPVSSSLANYAHSPSSCLDFGDNMQSTISRGSNEEIQDKNNYYPMKNCGGEKFDVQIEVEKRPRNRRKQNLSNYSFGMTSQDSYMPYEENRSRCHDTHNRDHFKTADNSNQNLVEELKRELLSSLLEKAPSKRTSSKSRRSSNHACKGGSDLCCMEACCLDQQDCFPQGKNQCLCSDNCCNHMNAQKCMHKKNLNTEKRCVIAEILNNDIDSCVNEDSCHYTCNCCPETSCCDQTNRNQKMPYDCGRAFPFQEECPNKTNAAKSCRCPTYRNGMGECCNGNEDNGDIHCCGMSNCHAFELPEIIKEVELPSPSYCCCSYQPMDCSQTCPMPSKPKKSCPVMDSDFGYQNAISCESEESSVRAAVRDGRPQKRREIKETCWNNGMQECMGEECCQSFDPKHRVVYPSKYRMCNSWSPSCNRC